MRLTLLMVLSAAFLQRQALADHGDGTFQSPLRIPTSGPICVTAGDFNLDGKLDLASVAGGKKVTVLLQGSSSRTSWTQQAITLGSGCYFVRAADFDDDGVFDLVVADPASTAYFLRGKGDGTFLAAVPFVEAQTARWVAVGDWNNDGRLDLATANHDALTVTVYTGQGDGNFTSVQKLQDLLEPHALEAFHYDADGSTDLMLGVARDGNLLLKGRGDGLFDQKGKITGLGCIGYIATGDFNHDGLSDLATTCKTTSASISVNLGNGTYRASVVTPLGAGVDSTAVADLNGDGAEDVAVTGNDSTSLFVYPGKGDGTFLPPLAFGPTGASPSFLIAADLDGDGHPDVISADTASSALSVFWGRSDGQFLETTHPVTGFTAAKALAVADLDGDGWPDLFFPSTSAPVIQVYEKPADGAPEKPTLLVNTTGTYSSLEAVDLDGDSVPDLVGASPADGTALVAYLKSDGSVRSELSLPAGVAPGAVKVGRISGGEFLDLAVPCSGSDSIAFFMAQGGGLFAAAENVATTGKPRAVALADLDGDGHTDLAVISPTSCGVQYGQGGGGFEAFVPLIQTVGRNFSDLAAGDLNNDGLVDLAVSETIASTVYLLLGSGSRQFKPPQTLKVGTSPHMLQLIDLNGDGLPDISTSNDSSQSVSVILNLGGGSFASQVSYPLGFTPLGHRVGDLDNDGALDLVAFSATTALVLPGRPVPSPPSLFLRGDSNGDGQVDISDVLHILFALYGGLPTDCEDALDSNDDGRVNTADAIRLLEYLFLAGPDLPPPFPSAGPDPTVDGLDCRRA
jgi:hypothetical protein